MKTTIELAKECGAKQSHSEFRSRVGINFSSYEMIEAFRKAVEADFVSRCEQVATIQSNGESKYAFVRPSCELELGTQLYALPIGDK